MIYSICIYTHHQLLYIVFKCTLSNRTRRLLLKFKSFWMFAPPFYFLSSCPFCITFLVFSLSHKFSTLIPVSLHLTNLRRFYHSAFFYQIQNAGTIVVNIGNIFARQMFSKVITSTERKIFHGAINKNPRRERTWWSKALRLFASRRKRQTKVL